jgi:hypothetical protein
MSEQSDDSLRMSPIIEIKCVGRTVKAYQAIDAMHVRNSHDRLRRIPDAQPRVRR